STSDGSRSGGERASFTDRERQELGGEIGAAGAGELGTEIGGARRRLGCAFARLRERALEAGAGRRLGRAQQVASDRIGITGVGMGLQQLRAAELARGARRLRRIHDLTWLPAQ